MMFTKIVVLLATLFSLTAATTFVNLTTGSTFIPTRNASIFSLFESPINQTQTNTSFAASELRSINTTDPVFPQTPNQQFILGSNIFGFAEVPGEAATRTNGTTFVRSNKDSDSAGQNLIVAGLFQTAFQGEVPGTTAIGSQFSVNQAVDGEADENELQGFTNFEILSADTGLTRGVEALTRTSAVSDGVDPRSRVSQNVAIGTSNTSSAGRCSFSSSSSGNDGESSSGCVGQAYITPTPN